MENTMKENIRIIVALMKAYGIRQIVLSPGNRDVPLVHMVENDEDFTCYSIVDERSAGFFALGLIERLNCPVAICCTSGTAMCNYVSAVSEAYYQRLPLLILTADRPHYFLNQNEDQMVPQLDLLKSVTKLSVQLPSIATEQDRWYCLNRVHASLLELDHHGKGPVHINFEVPDSATSISTGIVDKPVMLSRIRRFEVGRGKQDEWMDCIPQLLSSKIMLLYGQSGTVSEEETELLDLFSKKYDCVIVKDHMANLHCENAFNLYGALNIFSDVEIETLLPDIIITMGGNSVLFQSLKAALAKRKKHTKQWIVSEDGELRDSLRCLNSIFECTTFEFLSYYVNCDNIVNQTEEYIKQWKEALKCITLPDVPYSSLYSVKRLMEDIPEKSIFHIANSSSIRYTNLFELKKSVTVYCNRGTNGIDGSFSAFMGNATVSRELCFLLIGDLSFFYDLNACWNRYCGKNIRILLNNNEGAEIFHYSYGSKISEISYVSAEHNATAKGWIESRGFQYLCAHNQEEFEKAFPVFMNQNSEKPILFEVFSSKEKDAQILHDYYESNMTLNIKRRTKKIVKKMMEKNGTLDAMINKARQK